MQGFKKISKDVIEVVDLLSVHLSLDKPFSTYQASTTLDPHSVYIHNKSYCNGGVQNSPIPLTIGLQYNTKTNTFLNPSILNYAGYSMSNNIITVLDPLLCYISDNMPFKILVSSNKRLVNRAYVTNHLREKFPLVKGLKYNKNTFEFTNTQPMQKLVPIPKIHSVYTKHGKDLRKAAKSFSNIGVYDDTYFKRYADTFDVRFFLKNNRDRHKQDITISPTTLMETIENPTHLNIALLTLYNTASTYSIEKLTYALITRAIDKAINAHRDIWLLEHDGFSIKEIT